MKYAVTGGAGFIGSHLVDALAKKHEIVILDNLDSGKIQNIDSLLKKSSISFIKGDINDISLLKRHFEGVDGIFHQAAVSSVQQSIIDPKYTNETNITGTLNVLIAAKECGVKKVIFSSSAAVYGSSQELPKREDMLPDPQSPYAVSKLSGEYYMQVFDELYGMKTISLRYFNVFGPRQDLQSQYAAVIPLFITRVLKNEPLIIYGNGLQTRDFIYVKDVVNANIKAITKNVRGIFNIASSHRISINELAEKIMEISGKKVPVIYQDPRQGDIQNSYAEISLAKEKLNFMPNYDLKNGLTDTIEWYKKSMKM